MTDKLQKSGPSALREKTQYALTFGVIATMLLVAGFPFVVIFFFGVFAYFLWKTFSQPSRKGISEVFEFYLSSNEILRDDGRKWFGFEVRNAIERGESILQRMHGAPPLVYFSLGALYNKIGDHETAVNHLAYVIENSNSDESTYLHPSQDLREYVSLLRKIERDPKEAPQTSAAIRTLERLRRNKGVLILEESRQKAQAAAALKSLPKPGSEANGKPADEGEERLLKTVTDSGMEDREPMTDSRPETRRRSRFRRKSDSQSEDFSDRKPITEVLHDIYDKNVQ